MFTDPIAETYAGCSQLVALCDPSEVRMAYHQARLLESYGLNDIASYGVASFDQMLDEQQPDTVIVCTVDAYHDDYIIRSIARGCDVICEKPITTDAAKCRRLLAAIPPSGRSVRVTFNMRWIPGLTQVKKLLRSGAIGEVKHVHLEYMLNTSHGADYFRRWHSEKINSGGLLVHKSTHHFDIVNWLVERVPDTIYAQGSLVYYGKENAERRGESSLTRYDRYTGQDAVSDPFHIDLSKDEFQRGLYLNAESETGYVRDRNVFRSGIDIEDSMSVIVTYRNGPTLSYSLNAYCPYEGFRLHLSGDKGRIEYEERHASHIRQSEQESLDHGAVPSTWKRLTLLPLFERPREIPVQELPGGHGGGDPLLQEQMFSDQATPDDLGRNAGYEQGIASAIIGISANQSMATGRPVRVTDLLGEEFAAKDFRSMI